LSRRIGKSHSPYPPTHLKLLTLARDLKRRKSRERQRLFVSEGVRAVEELLRSPLQIRGALVAPQLVEAPRGAALIASLRTKGISVQEVGAHDFASAAETESPQGVIAVVEAPERSFATLSPEWTGTLIVLDAVQDPGNVGTIVRTAAALGAAATVAMPGTVDLWNAKVVRSAMGAHFTHPAFSSTWSELDAFRAESPTELLAADAAGEPVSTIQAAPRVALVVGNEGAGLTAEARARADRVVSLPLEGGVESLNVAVATGILLYLLRR
jgi:RNA methyltransferase, TrmH family